MKRRSFMIVIALLIAFITLSCSKKSTEPEVKTVATPTFTPPGGYIHQCSNCYDA